MNQTMKAALHAPLDLSGNRQDEITNAFGVTIIRCTVSMDHAFPVIRAVNAHDAMRASLIELTDWMREHTGPNDPNSPHDILVKAMAALAMAEGR